MLIFFLFYLIKVGIKSEYLIIVLEVEVVFVYFNRLIRNLFLFDILELYFFLDVGSMYYI